MGGICGAYVHMGCFWSFHMWSFFLNTPHICPLGVWQIGCQNVRFFSQKDIDEICRKVRRYIKSECIPLVFCSLNTNIPSLHRFPRASCQEGNGLKIFELVTYSSVVLRKPVLYLSQRPIYSIFHHNILKQRRKGGI